MNTITKPKLPPQRTGSHVAIVDPPGKSATSIRSGRPHQSASVQVQKSAGVQIVAAVQFAAAAFLFINMYPDLVVATEALANKIMVLLPVMILFVTAVGLWRRTPWGWSSACALYYFIALQSLATLLQGATGVIQVSYSVASVMLGLALAAIVTLNRTATLDNIRFTDQTSKAFCSRVSPATAGFLLALAVFLPQIIGR